MHYVADSNLNKAEEMLAADPALLLQASHVVTRSGWPDGCLQALCRAKTSKWQNLYCRTQQRKLGV